jgi:hypothetical protein
MRGAILMVLGLGIAAYTAFDRLQNPVPGDYEPLGIAIGCGPILLGGWVRQRGKKP